MEMIFTSVTTYDNDFQECHLCQAQHHERHDDCHSPRCDEAVSSGNAHSGDGDAEEETRLEGKHGVVVVNGFA